MMNDYWLTPEDYAIARENGISYRCAYERVYKNGWSLEDAITIPVGGKVSIWSQYREICEKNGITEASFRARLYKGIPPEEAASYPTSRKKRNAKITPEKIAQAEMNGISRNTFTCRVYKYRWSVERAMTEPVETKFKQKEKGAVSC